MLAVRPTLSGVGQRSGPRQLFDYERRLVGVVVTNGNHAERPSPERDRVAESPVGTALLSVGGSAGDPSSCTSLNMKAIRFSLVRGRQRAERRGVGWLRKQLP